MENIIENIRLMHGKSSVDSIEIYVERGCNPLASVSLLKDRRALTKKQLADYMELIDKES